MFVVLTFDDNDRIADTMDFALNTLAKHTHVDGTPIHLSFNVMGKALELGSWEPAAALANVYKDAKAAGHEIGNHSYDHLQDENYDAIPGNVLTKADWASQIVDSHAFIVSKCSLTEDDVSGWRTPRIEYTELMFDALAETAYLYDTSLTETAGQNGSTDVTWPYTLDNGQSSTTANINPFGAVIGSYPGLWELPLSSLKRDGLGDFIAVDYNAFQTGEGNMSGQEFRELLLKNLNLRLNGNRAPLVIAGHTGLFHQDYDSQPYWQTGTTFTERREAFNGFIREAVKIPEVRFVTQREMIEWLKAPTRR